MTNVEFLGCGSGINTLPKDTICRTSTCGYFIQDNTLCLLDAGEQVLDRLEDKEDLSRFDKIVVLLTHLHPDHCAGLGTLATRMHHVLKKKLYLWSDDDDYDFIISHQAGRLLDLQGNQNSYAYIHNSELNGIKVKSYPSEHSSNLSARSFLIQTPQGSFFWSGDGNGDSLQQMLQEEKPDHIYTEVSDGALPVHTPLDLLCQLFAPEKRNHMTCMHFANTDLMRRCQEEGFQLPDMAAGYLETIQETEAK